MAHYVYYRYKPVKEDRWVWRWRVQVMNRSQDELINEFTSIAFTRRGAEKMARKVMKTDHLRRLPYELREHPDQQDQQP